ncbi:hypothetical protein GTW40_30510, partial [Streptomyces sp. SID4985]|uniref:hypothetical protein n=1 Tax=Streptomyces sp. SID4985 TaxID=2690292 RepID=UPI00137F1EC9
MDAGADGTVVGELVGVGLPGDSEAPGVGDVRTVGLALGDAGGPLAPAAGTDGAPEAPGTAE